MTAPAPNLTDTRVIVGDLHGNHAAGRALLEHVGVLDARGRRRGGYWTAQMGDIIHGAAGVLDADRESLELAQRWFDVVLVGNHELPFLAAWGQSFKGMYRDGERARHPACQPELLRLFRAGFFHAAVSVDGWLLTHAGVNPEHCFDEGGRAVNQALRAALTDSAKLTRHLNVRFEARFMRRRGRDPLMDGSCPHRDGAGPLGSIFWTDLSALLEGCRARGNPVRQIVGHTPRFDSEPVMFGVSERDREEYAPPARFGSQPVWSVDLSGVDDGWVGGLVKAPDAAAWTAVSVPRPMRPQTDPAHPLLLSARGHTAKDWSLPYGGHD